LDCGFVCADNELAMDGIEMTRGDSPQNTYSGSLGGAVLPHRSDGPTERASDYRRRRELDRRARFTVPPYTKSVARQLDFARLPEAMVRRVHDILSEADSRRNEVSLADQRPRLKGYSELPEGKHEQSSYRKKALALAALALDDSRGRPNRYRVLAKSMGVELEDVVRLKKMISKRVVDRQRIRLKELADSISDPSEAARAQRQYLLEAAMDHIHSMIHGIIIHDFTTPSGVVTALDIRARTLEFLRGSQEPVNGSQMGCGQYSSYVAQKAVMLATFEAIKSLGLPIEFCRELHRLVPVGRMETFMRRIGGWWSSSDGADGKATGHA